MPLTSGYTLPVGQATRGLHLPSPPGPAGSTPCTERARVSVSVCVCKRERESQALNKSQFKTLLTTPH